ncbi:hypothetical protein HMPREF9056_00436 [Actinomyces sp. oral taxon 170 str. F0386]|nr:hypothetical protein HMPREF9056_00436 [Actinomyces sp. oral taxon 170 str. F0386]
MKSCVRGPEVSRKITLLPAVRQAAGTSQEICRKSTYGGNQMGLFLEISRNGVDGNERVNFPSPA